MPLYPCFHGLSPIAPIPARGKATDFPLLHPPPPYGTGSAGLPRARLTAYRKLLTRKLQSQNFSGPGTRLRLQEAAVREERR